MNSAYFQPTNPQNIKKINMDPKHLQLEIRLLISSIRLFISKIPTDKQARASLKLQNTIQSLNQKNADYNSILQSLQYQANFLKLTNPLQKFVQQEKVDKETDTLLKQDLDQLEERFEKKDKTDNPIDGTGTYVLKDGKLVKGQAEQKAKVDFSNWHAGNVDPEDLRRHKELLDRQHYRGPFWEGKPKPKSIMDEQNPLAAYAPDEDVSGELNPALSRPKDENWEKVKR